MQAQVKHLCVKRQDLVGSLSVENLHAGHLLAEGALHLAIFDFAGVEDLLEQGGFLDALVDADCGGGEKEDEAVEVDGIDDFHDGLGGRRRVERRLVVARQCIIYVLDDCTIVLAYGYRETDFEGFFVGYRVVARRKLKDLTL